MKERPILFSAPMVLAILDGRKTQTRRVIKSPLLKDETADAIFPDGSGRGWVAWFGPGPHSAKKTARLYPGEEGFKCPYGQPGDRLWVREAWRIGAWLEDPDPRIKLGAVSVDYIADGYAREEWLICDSDDLSRYRDQSIDDATKAGLVADEFGCFDWEHGKGPCRVRPSIHMPRAFSRITLEITGIRVERLQNITENDAKSEGPSMLDKQGTPHQTSRGAFAALWDRINYSRGFGWGLNPYVWVLQFKRS